RRQRSVLSYHTRSAKEQQELIMERTAWLFRRRHASWQRIGIAPSKFGALMRRSGCCHGRTFSLSTAVLGSRRTRHARSFETGRPGPLSGGRGWRLESETSIRLSGARRCRQPSFSRRRIWPLRICVPDRHTRTNTTHFHPAKGTNRLPGVRTRRFPNRLGPCLVSSASWGIIQALLCAAN
ncbi:LOW QUALITY PROTEIN: hypothetical protein N5P37_001327, partial [Trichoderma harzianum]